MARDKVYGAVVAHVRHLHMTPDTSSDVSPVYQPITGQTLIQMLS